MQSSIETITIDVAVVGAGGAGLRAALSCLQQGLSTLCLSKVPCTRSHTVAAQGGINAPLGNVTPDDWRWLMYDTVRGSDWLGDQDAIALLARHATEAITELEHFGVPFTRDDKGQIYQRAYGGQSTDFGRGPIAHRACAAADRTGHAMLHALHQQAMRAGLKLWEEVIVLDLLFNDENACTGLLLWELETGKLWRIQSKITILATGGFGQLFPETTASSICTGDGNAMVLRAGLPLQDMEFIQFHPTGLSPSGCLITEGARGEGGILRNGSGERFMERYAPHYLDLASRDVIARAISQEIFEGRGAGQDGQHVWLDVTALDEATLTHKLPTVLDLSRRFAGIDARKEWIPVAPCVHYTMGGIPANAAGQALNPTQADPNAPVTGLLTVGEAACNSVHGANRLGCNSLLDLVVFGKLAGETAAQLIQSGDTANRPAALDTALARFERRRTQQGSEHRMEVRRALHRLTRRSLGQHRQPDSLQQGVEGLREIWQRLNQTGMADRSRIWNTELVTLIELENLILQGMAACASALARAESRGAHYRTDSPERDDRNWLCHSLAWVDADSLAPRLATRPVIAEPTLPEATAIPPERRAY